MEARSLNETCVVTHCSSGPGTLVRAEMLLAAAVAAFLVAHGLYLRRLHSLCRFLQALCRVLVPLHSMEFAAEMSQHRSEMAASCVFFATEALRIFAICTFPLRIISLLTTRTAPVPTASFLLFALLAVGSVVFSKQLEARATAFVKVLMVVMIGISANIATMHENAGIDKIIPIMTYGRVVAVLVVSPSESLCFNVGLTMVKILEVLCKEATATSSLRWCVQELLCFLGVLFVAARLIQLQTMTAKETLSARELKRTSGAVTNLVSARSDAVVHLDENLRVKDPNWQLAATLGADTAALRGAEFQRFLPLQEDIKRLQTMCQVAAAAEADDGAQVVDMIHALLQTDCKSATFSARLFHVPIRMDGKRSHLIGICRSSDRPAEPPGQSEESSSSAWSTPQTRELPILEPFSSHPQAWSTTSSRRTRTVESSWISSTESRASSPLRAGPTQEANLEDKDVPLNIPIVWNSWQSSPPGKRIASRADGWTRDDPFPNGRLGMTRRYR